MIAPGRKSDLKLTKGTHTSSSWASYGVSIMRTLKKIDCVIIAPYHINMYRATLPFYTWPEVQCNKHIPGDIHCKCHHCFPWSNNPDSLQSVSFVPPLNSQQKYQCTNILYRTLRHACCRGVNIYNWGSLIRPAVLVLLRITITPITMGCGKIMDYSSDERKRRITCNYLFHCVSNVKYIWRCLFGLCRQDFSNFAVLQTLKKYFIRLGTPCWHTRGVSVQ